MLRRSLRYPRVFRFRPTLCQIRQFSAGDGKSADVNLDKKYQLSRLKTDSQKGALVNNLLYNVPMTIDDKTQSSHLQRQVLSILVDNEPGVLSKITGLLSSRGFNIDSLTVTSTTVPQLSRMTVTLKGAEHQLQQCKRQLEDVVNVWHVFDYTTVKTTDREMCLVKISLFPPSQDDPLSHYETGAHEDDGVISDIDDMEHMEHAAGYTSSIEDLNPASISRHDYKDLIEAHFHRQAVMQQLDIFGGSEVVDIGSDTLTVQITSNSRRIDAFIELLKPYGIIEVARSGIVSLPSSPVAGLFAENDEDQVPAQATDIGALPPS
eukprot:g986.t1